MIETRASKSFAKERRHSFRQQGSPLLPRASAKSATRVSPLLWLNLVCLDAPLVAVSWQWLFALTFHVESSYASRAALFLTAWSIYLADRIVDTFTLDPARPTSFRHRFCRRYRRLFIFWLAFLVVSDAWLIWRHLEPRILPAGALVGGLAVLYLAVNFISGTIWRAVPLKELTIGFVFAFGTVAAVWANTLPAGLSFIWAALLFGTLCSFNCICIAAWERGIDEAQGKTSIATRWPRIGRYVRVAGILLALLAFAAVAPGCLGIALCVGAGALLLVLVDGRRSLEPDARTALADLVLLTPVLAMLWSLISR